MSWGRGLRASILGAALLVLTGVQTLWAEWVPGEKRRPLTGLAGRLPGELLVQVKPGVTDGRLRPILNALEAEVSDEIPQIRVKRIKVPPHALERILESLNADEHTKFAEPNFLAEPMSTPDDYYYNSQWHLPKISAPEAWDLSTGAQNIPIAILDTGVDPAHPDLGAKLLPGYNFYDRNTDTSDVRGHGTAVAGAAAAISNNGRGVASVAWGNPILPIRISAPDGYATYSAMASAIIYAADHGAKVINLSYGGENYSSTLQSAVDYAWSKGAVVVASAANYSTDTPYYPAACDHVLAVSATNNNDQLTSFSNYGNWVDVAAPGVSIYTTSRGGGYGAFSGTSFSAPVTAGLAALIFSANPSLTNQEVVDILTGNADDLGAPGFDPIFAHGRINAHRSLLAAVEKRQESDTTPPLVIITSPQDGSTVSGGTVSVNVSATDNVGVTRVELYVNGSLHSSDTSPPYSFLWDTSQSPDGTYEFLAKAYDGAGNTASSGSVTLYLRRPDTTPPLVSITSPADGSTVSGGTVSVNVSATDNVGVTRVELYVNGSLHSSDTSPPYSFLWDTSQSPDGTYEFLAKAYDGAGNTAQSNSVTVNLTRADTTPPVLFIRSPKEGRTFTKKLKIEASALDDSGISRIELLVDGIFTASSTAGSMSYVLKGSDLSKGAHAITLKAVDLVGNVSTSQVTVYKGKKFSLHYARAVPNTGLYQRAQDTSTWIP